MAERKEGVVIVLAQREEGVGSEEEGAKSWGEEVGGGWKDEEECLQGRRGSPLEPWGQESSFLPPCVALQVHDKMAKRRKQDGY